MRDPSSRTPEEQLLLTLSIPDGPAWPAVDPAGVDWDWILQEAAYHRTLPTIGWRLRAAGLEDDGPDNPLPPGARRRAVDAYRHCAVWSALVGEACAGVVGALRAAGIRPIVLKGLAFAHTIYPTDALRTLGDLDLLVDPRAVEDARRILAERGFKLETAPYDEAYYRERHFHFRFVGPCGGAQLTIELHWALTPPHHYAHLATDELLGRAVPLEIDGERTWTLTPEDHLLHLCLQIDRFQAPLFRYADAHLVIECGRDTFDWDAFLARGIHCGVRRTAASFLHELRLLFGTAIPRRIRRRLAPHPLLEEALAVPYRLRSDRRMADPWGQLVGFLMRDRPEQKIEFLLRMPWVLAEDRLWQGGGAQGSPAVLGALRASLGMGITAAGLCAGKWTRARQGTPRFPLLDALWDRFSEATPEV